MLRPLAGAAWYLTLFITQIVMVLAVLTSVIWILVLKDWGAILIALLVSFILPWVFLVASLPSIGAMFLLKKCIENKDKALGTIAMILASIWDVSVLFSFTYTILLRFQEMSVEESVVPYLILGYATLMAPLNYMARKDRADNPANALALVSAQIWYGALVLLTVVLRTNLTVTFFAVAAIFLILLLLNVLNSLPVMAALWTDGAALVFPMRKWARAVSEDPAEIAQLRQNLRVKTLYNEPVIDRLIDFEREKTPKADLTQLMKNAIARWERDNQ